MKNIDVRYRKVGNGLRWYAHSNTGFSATGVANDTVAVMNAVYSAINRSDLCLPSSFTTLQVYNELENRSEPSIDLFFDSGKAKARVLARR